MATTANKLSPFDAERIEKLEGIFAAAMTELEIYINDLVDFLNDETADRSVTGDQVADAYQVWASLRSDCENFAEEFVVLDRALDELSHARRYGRPGSEVPRYTGRIRQFELLNIGRAA